MEIFSVVLTTDNDTQGAASALAPNCLQSPMEYQSCKDKYGTPCIIEIYL